MASAKVGDPAAGKSWREVYEGAVESSEDSPERARAEEDLSGVASIPEREGPKEGEDVAQDPDKLPDWAQIPPPESGFRFPSQGRRVFFVRFRAEWTDAPAKGDRTCVLWTLSDSEENVAAKRAGGESFRTHKEMTKMMVRAIDGHKVDWSGKKPEGNVARFWEEIGPSCRAILVNVYQRNHSPKQEVILDFFVNCFAARSAVAG